MTTPDLPPPLNTFEKQTTSGLAITSMILGIVSLLGGALLLLPPILAVVFGHISLSSIRKDPAVGGRGMGIAGLVMGYVCLVPLLLLPIMAIPAFNKVREAAQQKAIENNALQLAYGAEQYFIEEGVDTVTLETLYDGEYVFELVTIDDETYPTVFKVGEPVVVTLTSGDTVTFEIPDF